MVNKNTLPISGEIKQPVFYASILHEDTWGALEIDKVNEITFNRLQAGQVEANLLLATRLRTAPDHVQTKAETEFLQDMADTSPEDIVELHNAANGTERLLRLELSGVRYDLGTLSTKQQKKVEKYLNTSVPEFFANVKEHSGTKGQNWVSWLSETASNEQLVNFLQWHVHTLAKQRRSPLVVAKIRQSWTEFSEAATRGANEGFLGHVALRVNEDPCRAEKVYIGNIFEEAFLDGAEAHAQKILGEVMVKQGEGKDHKTRVATLLKRMDDTLWHEFSHIFFNDFRQDWWYEAGIEHLRLSLQEGDTENISPRSRGEAIIELNDKEPPEGSGYYQEDRELLACLGVDPYLMARAFSGTYADKQIFIRSLDQLWGVKDAIKKVGQKLAEYQSEAAKSALPKRLGEWRAQRIAFRRVSHELVSQPELVFGPFEYQPDLKAVA